MVAQWSPLRGCCPRRRSRRSANRRLPKSSRITPKFAHSQEISRDLIDRLHAHGLIGTGPRSPRRGAPYSFVTTGHFLAAFGLESLHDLPDREQLEDAGLAGC